MSRGLDNTVKLSGEVINWLLEKDPSLSWQVQADLLDRSPEEYNDIRNRIPVEGWGKFLLDQQDRGYTWDNGLYGPKYTSTTYTLLLLRRLGLLPGKKNIEQACRVLMDKGIGGDGGAQFKWKRSEMCVSGMFLSIFSYFQIKDDRIQNLLDYISNNQLGDGGWNCRFNRTETKHSSFNTTLLVLEGLREYQNLQPSTMMEELIAAGCKFLLKHRLYQSHRTDEIADKHFLHISFPPRWKYNVLSSLDFFQSIEHEYDRRLEPAIEYVKSLKKAGRWPKGPKIRGKTWLELEEPRKPGRWNTLRALRVLKWWTNTVES